MKMRKDKNEKRRLQLNRRKNVSDNTMNQAERNTRSGRVMFPKAGTSSDIVYVNSSSAAAKKAVDLNHRATAFILALVFILSVIPVGVFLHLRGRAEETISAAMEAVEMSLYVNGKDTGKKVTVEPGEITASSVDLGNYELPDGAEYIKSVVYDKSLKTKTQIFSAGAKTINNNTTTYYSINQDGYTGVATGRDDVLIIEYANVYKLTFGGAQAQSDGSFEVTDGGTFRTNAIKDGTDWIIYGGEDLIIQEVKPNQDRTASKVTYTSTKAKGTERISNSTATISSGMILADTDISVQFNEVEKYTVQDARYMSGSKYYSQYKGLDNHGGTSQSETTKSSTNSLDSVKPGKTATFYVFSQKNTGTQDWELSMLSVNGVDLKFPTNIGTNNAVTTPFGDENITVTFVNRSTKFGGTDGPRTLYKIEVPNVHENIEVNYYFTNTKERKVIVKGLRGISKTAAAVENRTGTGLLSGVYYTYTSNKLNVYDAYYHGLTLSGANLIIYAVKPGYNPYAITTSIICDGEERGVRATSVTGAPVDVIADAGKTDSREGGRFNTSWRYWGKNSILANKDDYKTLTQTKECILTTIARDTSYTWYGVAMSQDEATNQQLYLNAVPYNYRITLDLDGGDESSIKDADYNNLVEVNSHTVETNTYGFLPSDTPTKAGYVFGGWRMLASDGQTALSGTEYLFDESARIDLDDTVFENAVGDITKQDNSEDLLIKFKAIWKLRKDADITYVSAEAYVQNGINSDGTASYEQNTLGYTAQTETQIAKVNTAFLNDKTDLSDNPYYTVNAGSHLVGTTDDVDDVADLANHSDNQFVVKYDYTLYDIKVSNTVLGYPNTKNFPVTVTLTPDEDSPVTVAMEKALLSANAGSATVTSKNGSVIYSTTLKAGEDFTIQVPHNWTYTVSAETVEGDYKNQIEPQATNTATKNAEIEITTISNNSGIETNKTISGPDENGKYTIILESWATGQSFTKPVKSTTPLDIVLVIDQSGSMGNEDMNPTFAEENKAWTAKEAAGSDTTYYYKVGDGETASYYPVQAETGDYFKSTGTQKARTLTGVGHASTVGIGSKPHYNVPSNYYFVDNNNDAHKVFFIVVGANAHYCVYAYYYVDENDPVASKDEWVTNTGIWVSFDYPKGDLVNDSTWNTLVTEGRIKLVPSKTGQAGLTYSTSNLIHYGFMWGGVLYDDTISSLSTKTESKVANRLYYVNDDGDVVYLSDRVIDDSTTAYEGPLYYVSTGTKRVKALQDAVNSFATAVADHATETGVTHRIAVAGFAGNERPGTSRSNGDFNCSGFNKSYDYVNTGLFTNSGAFKNYQEITGFTSISSSNLKTNAHYYIDFNKNGNPDTYQPIVRINDSWYRINNHGYYSVTPSSYNIYEPVYAPLDDNSGNQYTKAFMDVASNEGTVNSTLTGIIDDFGSYGGTYTSYGMAMANQIFANNSSNGRKRVVVVFTDGEPGSSGYDDAIAGEAVFDSEIAKSTYDASVYTVGLFVGQPTSEVRTFMSKLSSNSNVTQTNVMKGNLNPNKIYYYYDSTNKKTYSVSTEYQSEATLGWWTNTNSKVYPKETSSDNTSGRVTFYEKKTSIHGRISYSAVYGSDIDSTETYYLDSKGNTTITYGYKWYDSDGYIVEPKATSSGSGYQFFEEGSVTANSDGISYYQSTNNATGLQTIFNNISNSITNLTTTVYLDSDRSLMKDIITENFTNLSSLNVKVETVEGRYVTNGDTSTLTWLDGTDGTTNTTSDITSSVTTKVDGNELSITQYNYSTNYVSASRPTADGNGKKMVVTISGLTPKETGFDLASNTDESGVFERVFKDDDPTKAEEDAKMLKEFSIPEVDRPTYNLHVDGDDTDTTYTVKFKVKDKDDKYVTLSFTQPVLKDGTLSQISFDNGEATWTTAKAGDDDQNIVFENLPDGYTVEAVVTKNTSSTDYDYTVKVDNKVQKDGDNVRSFDDVLTLPNSGSEIEISSSRKTTDVTIREITTKTATSTASYADPDKMFKILLTLKSGDELVSGTFDGLVFTDGVAELEMKHEQQKTFALPVGYTLSIDVDSETQEETYGSYLDSYAENLTETQPTSATNDSFSKVISEGMKVTVINSIQEQTPPTGFLDGKQLSPWVWVLVGMCLTVAAGFGIYDRRKRRLNN